MWLELNGIRIYLANPADIAQHKRLGYIEVAPATVDPLPEPEVQEAQAPVAPAAPEAKPAGRSKKPKGGE